MKAILNFVSCLQEGILGAELANVATAALLTLYKPEDICRPYFHKKLVSIMFSNVILTVHMSVDSIHICVSVYCIVCVC